MYKRKTIMILSMAIAFFFTLAACGEQSDPTLAAEVATEQPEVETAEPADVPEATEAPALTEEPDPWPQEFTDGLGRSITLDAPATQIVTLGASVLESLFAIGAGDQVSGREEFSTFPEEALEIPSVGSLWGELPSEAIVALEPDLVIAAEIISPEQVAALEELGLLVFWQANPIDFEGLYVNIRELADLSDHRDEAEELIQAMSQRVAGVIAVVGTVSENPTVFYELDATDPENPYTVGTGNFIDTLINMAGGVNIGAVLEGEYAMISSEELIVQNPDIILLSDAAYGITPESVAARPGWDAIAAVVNGQVLPFDPFLVSVPGPRLVDGLEEMARLFHPDLFD